MENRYKIGEKTALTGIITNIVLSGIKLIAGIISGSTAMIADASHSISDILATTTVMISFKIAKKPEDTKHPYGHEKAEPIAAKILSIFLFAAGIGIGWNAIKIIQSGNIASPGITALYAAVLSIIVKECLFWYCFLASKRINSTALRAEAWHHRSDALSSIGTLIGIGAARLGLPIADPLAGILVSLLIIRIAYSIYIKSIGELMDSSAPPDKVKAIGDVIIRIDRVKAIEKLKTRMHGDRLYVDTDILVDHFISVSQGHEIADTVETNVKSNFSDVKDIMVHVNPCNPSMKEFCNKCLHKCKQYME